MILELGSFPVKAAVTLLDDNLQVAVVVVENDLKEKPNHITIISFSYTNTLPPPRKRTSFYWKETRLVHNRTCPWVLLLLDLLRVEEAGLLETSEVDTYGQHLPTTQKKNSSISKLLFANV